MQSREPISRLRASEPRTSDNACGGWPTPTARDWKDVGDLSNVPENGLLGRVYKNLTGVDLPPQMSAWLMGVPAEWDESAPTATPSSRK